MILVKMIPLSQVVMANLSDLAMLYPQFTLVKSQGYLKIYKQIK